MAQYQETDQDEGYEDKIKLMEILYVQSAFKVFRITLQIMITTYIVGIVFYIFADLVLENKLSKIEEGDDRPDTFIETFDLE